MSDDEDVTYVKKHRSIHYGSLEEQERARLVGVTAIVDDNNGESGPSTVSENAQIHISNEYMDLEDAMSKDKQALLEEFERRKKARQINVSTDDAEVKRNLRQLGEPICLFGEGPAERRSRLKDILSWNAKKRGVKSNDTPKKRHRNGRLHDLSKVIRAMSHKTGEDCGCKRYECFKKITKKERDRLIAEFNALQSKDKQSLYLSELISILPVHKRRSRKVESVKTRKAKNKSSRKSPRKSKTPRKTRNPRKLRTPSESENDSLSESESPIKTECISPNKSDNVIPSKSDTISASNSDIINSNAPDTSTIKAENTVPVKTKKVAGPHEHSYKYKVRILREGKLVEVQVCHKAFISLHGITNQTLFTIKKSLTTNKKAPIDGRGKHKNRTHAISQETLGKVCDHIRSCRMYLPEKLTLKGRKAQELSIKKLHRMYMEQHPLNLVSYEYYRTVCSNKFNISFGSPRSDKCSICEAHQAEVRDLELKKLNAIQVLNDINNELQKVKAVSDVHKKINHVTNGSEITNKNSLGY